MEIKAKIAIVEFSLSIEDFLEEWADLEEEGEPAQEDYDGFLEAGMRGYLQREGDCAKVFLKIKR